MIADLELLTTEQLVKELIHRTTFRGVVIHSKDEARSQSWEDEDVYFKIHTNNNLEISQLVHLLESVADHLKEEAAQ